MDDQIVLHLPDDIHKLCRTCMSVTENVVCHDIVLIDSEKQTLAGEMLQFCFSNPVESEDGLPKSICDECASSLELFYNFKYQCEQTEINLRKILNLPPKDKCLDIKQNESVRNNAGILNCTAQSSVGVAIHENISLQNYIDNTIEVSEGSEITVETFQKIRDCSNINLQHITEISETQDCSSLQNNIIALIEERKEAGDDNITAGDIDSLDEECNESNIKQELFSDDEDSGEINCKLCDEVFANASEFRNHSKFCKNKTELENILKLENDSIDQLELYQDENFVSYPHMCTICGSKFKTKQGKSSHMTAHEKATEEVVNQDAPYTCDLCNKIFMTEPKLSSHFYKHATQIRTELEACDTIETKKNFTCKICYESYESNQELKEHSKRHTKTGKVSCEICNIDFDGEINLVRHLRKHGIHILLCKICLKRFDNLLKLKEHMKTHLIESVKTTFKCAICKVEFVDIESLKIHSVEHLNDVYECTKCKKTFYNKVAYENHEKQHIEPRFLCSLCGKQYFSSVTLACHIRAHNNEKPFICPHCKKGFSSRATLSVHKRIHSAFKPYVCSYCGYSCRQSGDLAMHIRTHTGDKPYKCTFPNCERKFTTSSQRKEHYRRHTNERNHKCPLCGKAFLESKTLKVHMLVHTGEKPHCCEVCGKKFRRTHHLSNHMKGHKEHFLVNGM